jgi:tRNA1Val (adenine37-N6)-methyltransferase
LTGEGILQVIMPVAEGRKFVEMAPDYELYCCRIIHVSPTPSSGPKRMVMAFSRRKSEVSESNLTIETGIRHEYTPEFVELIREFYLKF